MKLNLKYIFLLCFLLLLPISIIFTRPEYTLLTGNRCLNCHISPQGGGQRNGLGAYARNETSLITNKAVKSFFSDFNSLNTFADDKLLWGFDFRSQTARLGDPSDSERDFFLMQITPYLSYMPTEWLSFSGQYNLIYAFDWTKDNNEKTVRYPGQETWQASVLLTPDVKLPALKLGFFAPSIGTKYDDHTLFVRQIWTNRPFTVLPPDNSELAAELDWSSLQWLQLTAGIYRANTLSQIKMLNSKGELIPLAEANTLSYLFKAVFTPRFAQNFINTYIGGSYFANGDYSIISGFAGLGLTNYLSLLGEFTKFKKNNIIEAANYSIQAYYLLFDALGLTVRYEGATTDDYSQPDNENNTVYTNYITHSLVFGGSVFVLPNFEIRPEYRILDRKYYESYAAQWTVQLHLYY